MNCKYCGAELDDGVMECPACGKAQTDEEIAAAETDEEAVAAEQTAAESGYMTFSIENGRLIETKTDNVDVEFVMIDGRLCIV